MNNEKLGIINATGATNSLILDGPVSNAGLMEATGAGHLTIDAENAGNAEDIANTGVIAANTGSIVTLEAGIITGGTLKTSGTGAIQVTTSGSAFLVFDGSNEIVHTNTMINVEGNVEVSSGSALGMAGTIRNTGNILDGFGSTIDLFSGGTVKPVILEGLGTITLSSGSIIEGDAGLNNVNDTISGSGTIENAALNNETGGDVEQFGGGQLVINTGIRDRTDERTNRGNQCRNPASRFLKRAIRRQRRRQQRHPDCKQRYRHGSRRRHRHGQRRHQGTRRGRVRRGFNQSP